MNRPFDSLVTIEILPPPIAAVARAMLIEIQVSGEHSTADETVLVIESVLTYITRLWVAEYINAEAFDDEINSYLLDSTKNNLTVGQWVALGRTLRDCFITHNVDTVIHNLKKLDFGTQGDGDHSIAKLISYRNSFSHGSMAAVTEDIRYYRELIETVLMSLPALWEQPALFFSKQNRIWIEATGTWVESQQVPKDDILPLQPVILSVDKSRCLKLYPLFYIKENNTGYEWKISTAKNKTIPLSGIFELDRLKVWAERYEYERLGHIDTQIDFLSETSPKISAEMLSQVAEKIVVRDNNLIIINAYPGCDKANAICAIYKHFSNDSKKPAFSDIFIYDIKSNHLSQSGFTFGHFILRKIEVLLELTDQTFFHRKTPLQTLLTEAFSALQKSGKHLLICIDNLHFGAKPFRRESLSIIDIYNSLPTGNLTLLATLLNGSIKQKLLFDEIIQWPIPDGSLPNHQDLTNTIETLCNNAAPIRKDILLCLKDAKNPLSLFEVCDSLEKLTKKPVFEPEVEHHLWQLSAVLNESFSIENQHKKWCLFHSDCAVIIS